MDGSMRLVGTIQQRDDAASARPAIPDDHPVLLAFMHAPVIHGTITDEEREAVAAASTGPWIPHEEVMAELETRRPR